MGEGGGAEERDPVANCPRGKAQGGGAETPPPGAAAAPKGPETTLGGLERSIAG